MEKKAFMRRVLLPVLQWGISLGALGYALAGVDVGTLAAALKGYSPAAMLLVFAAAALDYACLGLRLRCLLPSGFSYGRSMAAALLCVGYNSILPAKAGDALKIVYLRKKTGQSLLAMGAIVFWERLLDVLALLCASLLAYALAGTEARLVLPLCCCLLAGGLLYVCRRWSVHFHRWYARIPVGKAGAWLSELHSRIIDDVSAAWIARGFVLSLVIWACYFASFAFALLYVAALPLTLPQVLTVFAVTCLGAAVPSSPGGLGVFEGAMVLSLSWFGVERSAALGIALFIHAVHFIPLAAIAVGLNSCRDFWKAESFSSH